MKQVGRFQFIPEVRVDDETIREARLLDTVTGKVWFRDDSEWVPHVHPVAHEDGTPIPRKHRRLSARSRRLGDVS